MSDSELPEQSPMPLADISPVIQQMQVEKAKKALDLKYDEWMTEYVNGREPAFFSVRLVWVPMRALIFPPL